MFNLRGLHKRRSVPATPDDSRSWRVTKYNINTHPPAGPLRPVGEDEPLELSLQGSETSLQEGSELPELHTERPPSVASGMSAAKDFSFSTPLSSRGPQNGLAE